MVSSAYVLGSGWGRCSPVDAILQIHNVTYIIHVNIDSSEVRQNEVADCISTHDRIRVVIECLQKPWVFCRNELSGFFVRP